MPQITFGQGIAVTAVSLTAVALFFTLYMKHYPREDNSETLIERIGVIEKDLNRQSCSKPW